MFDLVKIKNLLQRSHKFERPRHKNPNFSNFSSITFKASESVFPKHSEHVNIFYLESGTLLGTD